MDKTGIIILVIIIIIIIIVIINRNNTNNTIEEEFELFDFSHYSKVGYTFNNLFRLKPLIINETLLMRLAEKMVTINVKFSNIDAGYTFLGQFIAHDMTFNETFNFNDIKSNTNIRTPFLDLDSLYGKGSVDMPYLFDGKKLIFNDVDTDLFRTPNGTALIGDPRNDENFIIAQLQLLFIKFHNKVLIRHGDFKRTRREVTWHYQWIVVNDFLRKFVGDKIVDDILDNGNKFYKQISNTSPKEGVIPHEFSIAAFRFGHATLLNEYQINAIEIISLLDLFTRRDLTINWEFFFGGNQKTKIIEPKLVETLANLPIPKPKELITNSLAFRNLLRGQMFKLISGQVLARRLNVKELTPNEVGFNKLNNCGLGDIALNTPMWYYMLQESYVKYKGEQLGDTAGIIVVEVIIGILRASKNSYLAQDNWTPTLPSRIKNQFDMIDLINFTLS